MAITQLKGQIDRLPEQPGVYVFANGDGATIYVGKARVLRDRVRSYLSARGSSPKTDALLDEAAGLEVIVTDSVVEALALENHLIKQRAPRYNILLRDDKNYPYLQLTTTERFPRVLVARRVERDGAFYAGPFLPASLARRTMTLTHKLFGLRSCNEHIDGHRGRPCLEYDIKRCLAPCVEAICTEDEYRRAVEDTRLFLEGRNEELVEDLTARMQAAAAAERFEQAAQLRDAIRTVETLRDRQQKMASPQLGDRDAFGVQVGPAGAVVEVFQVRGGRVVERVELAWEAGPRKVHGTTTEGPRKAHGTTTERTRNEYGADTEGTRRELLRLAVQQFYETRSAPPQIHLPDDIDEAEAETLEAWLSDRTGRRVRLVVPRRGEKRGLLELAARNATVAYESRFNPTVAANFEALETLGAALGLAALPRRIECFDISTIQGRDTVAAMVVCEDGRMKRSDYRKFRIRGSMAKPARRGQDADTPAPAAAVSSESASPRAAARGGGAPRALMNDDFASMNEVVHRRYRKLLEQGGPFPDLVIIDGGKGQLSSAYDAFAGLGLANLVAIGLAKREELVYTRDRAEPVALVTDSPALHLIQRIRDEAHRFAVTFHRQSRTRGDLRSALDEIPGIGPRRRRALLGRFGSVAGVRRATREELVGAVGARIADAVLAHFARAR